MIVQQHCHSDAQSRKYTLFSRGNHAWIKTIFLRGGERDLGINLLPTSIQRDRMPIQQYFYVNIASN